MSYPAIERTTPGAAAQTIPLRRFRPLSTADLVDGDFSLNWLVDGAIVEHQPALWVGPEKGMKSSVAIEAALSISTGTPFLRHFATQKRRCAFWNGESGMATIQETINRICHHKGIEARDVEADWYDELPDIMSESGLREFRREIEAAQSEVVFLDCAYLLFSGEGVENMFTQGERLRRLNDVFTETKSTLILLHHSKTLAKNRIYARPTIADGAFSGFKQWARQFVMLNRRNAYGFDGEHALWLRMSGSAGHAQGWMLDISEGTAETGRHWSATLERDGAPPADVKARLADRNAERSAAARQNNLDAMLTRLSEAQADGLSRNKLRGKIGEDQFKAALKLGLETGRITKDEGGRYRHG